MFSRLFFFAKHIDKVRIYCKISVMHDCIRLYHDVSEEIMRLD